MKVAWIANRWDGWCHPWLPDLTAALIGQGVQVRVFAWRIDRALAGRLQLAGAETCGAAGWMRFRPMWQGAWQLSIGWPSADVYHFWDSSLAPAWSRLRPVVTGPGPSASTGLAARWYARRVRHHLARFHPVGHPVWCHPPFSCVESAWYANGPSLVQAASQVQVPLPDGAVLSPHPAAGQLGIAGIRLKDGATLVGTIADLAPESRVDQIIWQMGLVHHVVDRLQLLVLGDGPATERLRKFATHIRSAGCVQFVTDPQSALSLLPRLRCLLLPSDQPLLEWWIHQALRLGIPVLAFDTPWTRRFIHPERTGILVPRGHRSELARQIHRLIVDDALHRRLSHQCRHSARKLPSVAEAAEALGHLYHRVHQGHCRRAVVGSA